jgi:hypothetical protein
MSQNKNIVIPVIMFCCCVAVAARGQDQVLTGPLRSAIRDLTVSYGAGYGKGVEFIGRLEAIEKKLKSGQDTESVKAAADFAVLQREALLANPLVSNQPVLYVVRPQYRSSYHAVDTLFHTGEANMGNFQGGSALKVIDFGKGGETRTVLDCPGGIIREPNLHFEGRRVVFAMRRNINEDYHVWEINTDGSGLKQLTCAEGVSDYNPIYLPDDSIVFSSTREPKYNQCSQDIAANMFRMESDGANIHQISRNNLIDDQVSLMEDGRILYSRWEYVDRNFGDAHGLWTANPDGTSHLIYWKNNSSVPPAVYMARQIPGSAQVVCIFGPHHDHLWGSLAIVDRRLGLDGRPGIVQTWPAEAVNHARIGGGFACDDMMGCKLKFATPFPLSSKYILCSRMTGKGMEMALFLVDVFGNELLLHVEGQGCYEPIPLQARVRPPLIPSRRNYQDSQSYCYVLDVYNGTNMKGVKKGSVKSIRVVEVPEKRHWSPGKWFGQGYMAPGMNWHSLEAKRVLGTAPVETDGSAYLVLPSEKFVYFQLLDKNGMMIQSMRSGAYLQPGEKSGCVGCHDNRLAAPVLSATGLPLALRRSPDQLKNPQGEPRSFGYTAEIQPIFNKHCLDCHDYGKEGAKKLVLASDRDLTFCTSYVELWRKRYVTCVGAGPAEIQEAYSWGSHPSRLVKLLREGHRDVKLSADEMGRIITWVDLNGVYYPTYQCAYPESVSGRCPLTRPQLKRLCDLVGAPFVWKDEGSPFNNFGSPGVMVSFDRPELSPCLAKFTDKTAAEYKEALALIQAGGAQLAKQPEADRPGFVPCEKDRQREQKYAIQRQMELRYREAILNKARLNDRQLTTVVLNK